MGRQARERVTLLKRDPGALSAERPRASATLPAGHPQGYNDCFDAFVADAYAAAVTGEAPEGCPTSVTGCAPRASPPRCSRRRAPRPGSTCPTRRP